MVARSDVQITTRRSSHTEDCHPAALSMSVSGVAPAGQSLTLVLKLSIRSSVSLCAGPCPGQNCTGAVTHPALARAIAIKTTHFIVSPTSRRAKAYLN